MFRKNYSVGSAQNLNINVFTRYVAFSMYWGGGGGEGKMCNGLLAWVGSLPGKIRMGRNP